MLLALLLAPLPAAAQQRASLANHLEQALAIDAAFRTLAAQRDAVAAQRALVRSAIPGSPSVGGDWRSNLRAGPGEANEANLDVAAPVWLPGQRAALGDTVRAGVEEFEARLLLRRLEVAGLLREALWNAASAGRDLRVARDRLATSRDIARDVQRRVDLGDIPFTDSLLVQNETLGAELGLAQAEAALIAARAVYRVLTGGAEPDLPAEAVIVVPPRVHPALLAANAGVAAAEAQVRLVAATPRDNPEVGVFGRNDAGRVNDLGASLGVRVRVPLASNARNIPRAASAQADLTRAVAERALRLRLLNAEIEASRVALRAAEEAARIARRRLAVANQQLDLARRAFNAGETGLFDLFRIRQLQVEAAGGQAQAEVNAGRARSRVNQAVGAVPGAEAHFVSAR
ncbi:TolC family protein [Craurococcus roseus]|uniref:TolC family protein n=1 Tax=Craurococcus roseus TaxID=77585 RepID=A0ABP3PTX4_9PROT